MADAQLREQLRRLGIGQGARHLKDRPKKRGRSIEDLIPGEVVGSSLGSFYLHRETYEPDYRHGHHVLVDLLDHDPQTTAALAHDGRLAEIGFRRMAFVDTETTGLAGGTGTYAFLVGVGVFDGDRFTIHQFFMRDYHEEPAQLQALGDLLDGLDAVVSFNGRSFDLPLLETRFIMTRQTPRLTNAPHLDLLPVSRSLWKYRLASCALSALEPEILGVRRTEADVPGWLIPSLYVQYTRGGDAREIARVFYHNAQDILSLVTLAARQCDLLTMPLPAENRLPGEDLYGLGRLHQALGQLDSAEAAFVQAAQSCKSRDVREMSMRDLAYLLKRQDRRHEALPWWQRLVEVVDAVYACEELAKHFEWQDQDLSQAMAWTQHGIDLARQWPSGPKRRTALMELNHRQERLARKQDDLGELQGSVAAS